jgi:hypothetical protein
MRKCIAYGEFHFFHKFIEIGTTKMHPEDPQKDHCYSHTYALVEDVDGILHQYDVSKIKFLDTLNFINADSVTINQ